MKLITFLEAISKSDEPDMEEMVGSNEGEIHSEDDEFHPFTTATGEEGNAGWDWTDPYHSSGSENAVVSNKP